MSDIKGLSLIIGKGIFHVGSYKKGIWFDNCEIQDIPKEQRTGSGIKFDICFGYIIRPIGLLYKKEYWDNEALKIQDIPQDQWNDFFGKELADKIRYLPSDRYHKGCYNPWYAKKWFVFRLPKWIPSIFISVGFGKLWSFYIGNKSYQIDVLTRDITWIEDIDIERSIRKYPLVSYIALCPSATSRKTRMT